MVNAVLAKTPGLDPADITDLMLGVGQPAGESGNNLARVVSVLAGLDHLPGVTVNRSSHRATLRRWQPAGRAPAPRAPEDVRGAYTEPRTPS